MAPKVPGRGEAKGNTSGLIGGSSWNRLERRSCRVRFEPHGFQSNWKAKGYALSKATKHLFNAEAAQRQAQRSKSGW